MEARRSLNYIRIKSIRDVSSPAVILSCEVAIDQVLNGIQRVKTLRKADIQSPRKLTEALKNGQLATQSSLLNFAPSLISRRIAAGKDITENRPAYVPLLERSIKAAFESFFYKPKGSSCMNEASFLKDIITLSAGSLQADYLIDRIFLHMASSIRDATPLLTEVLYQLIEATLKPNDEHVRIDLKNPHGFLAAGKVAHKSLYDSILSRALVMCMSESQPPSAYQSVFFDILLHAPSISTSVWTGVANHLAAKGDSMSNLKMIIDALAILFTRKPLHQGSILTLLLHLSSCPQETTRNNALHAIFTYFSHDQSFDIYMQEIHGTGKSSMQLKCILQNIANSNIDQCFREIEQSLEEGYLPAYASAINITLNEELSLPFYAKSDKLSSMEHFFNHVSHLDRRKQLDFLAILRKSDIFLKTLIELSTTMEFYSLLLRKCADMEVLIGFSLEFLCEYFIEAQKRVQECGSNATLSICHAGMQILAQTLQRMDRNLPSTFQCMLHIARFADKRYFTQIILPHFLNNAQEATSVLPQLLQGALCSHADGERSIAPGELLFHLHTLPTSDANLPAVTAIIEELIHLKGPGSVDKHVLSVNSIVEAMQRLLQLNVWPILSVDTLMKCLVPHHEALISWVARYFLPIFVDRKVWSSDPHIWAECIKLVSKNVKDMIPVLLRAPDTVVSEALQNHEELTANVRLSLETLSLPDNVARKLVSFLK